MYFPCSCPWRLTSNFFPAKSSCRASTCPLIMIFGVIPRAQTIAHPRCTDFSKGNLFLLLPLPGYGRLVCSASTKFFSWLPLMDSLSTRAMPQRKIFYLSSYDCIMCNEHFIEDREHLFLGCPFAKHCRHYLCSFVQLSDDLRAHLRCLMSDLDVTFFMDHLVVSWNIWISIMTRSSITEFLIFIDVGRILKMS